MRVAQINVTYGDSDSTGRNVKDLHAYFIKNGVASSVFITKINDDSVIDENIHLFSMNAENHLHAFLSRLTGKQGYFSQCSTRRLISELRKFKPDAVMLHVLHGNCVHFPLLFRYFSHEHIPVVIVLHDCWYYTGHCCHYTQAKCEKWKQNCHNCPQIHEWNKSLFFDTADKCLRNKKQWFDSVSRLGVIGVSDWITGEAKASILKNAAIIRRIYNWIDLETFKPKNTKVLRERLGIAQDKKVLLGVASGWSDRKGLKEMLQVALHMPEAKVIMIGKMPKNITIPENMICKGLVKDPAMLSEYYSMADVFLNPSVQETFGKTTAEALSCGTPVIAYNTTACAELVGDNCGKVVGTITPQEYLNTVIEFLRKPKETDACRRFAVENFDYFHSCKQYLDFLSQLCATEDGGK